MYLPLPLVSIQILNWNRADETLRAIASAKNQTYSNFEIIVVDNGSFDDSIEKIERFYPEVTLIKLNKNYGCPGGRNRGMKYCKGEYIFYLDNDGVLHEKAVEYAVNTIVTNPNIAVVTGQVWDFTEVSQIDTQFNVDNTSNIPMVNTFQGGICLHRKKIYETTGEYPDDFVYGAEESYLSLKILDANLLIVKNSSVILWHKESSLARDVKKEQTQALINKFVTAYSLFPPIYLMLFIVNYLIKYTWVSYREKYFTYFIKRSFNEIFNRCKKANRNPIKNTTFIQYKKLPHFSQI